MRWGDRCRTGRPASNPCRRSPSRPRRRSRPHVASWRPAGPSPRMRCSRHAGRRVRPASATCGRLAGRSLRPTSDSQWPIHADPAHRRAQSIRRPNRHRPRMGHARPLVGEGGVRRDPRRHRHHAGVFVKTQLPPEVWERFKELTLETSVHVTGEVRAEPRAPGGYEMGVTDLAIIGPSPIDYPIQPKEHGDRFSPRHRHFWLRSNRVARDLRDPQRDRAGDSRFLLRARIPARRHADSHRRDRRAQRAVLDRILRRRQRLSRADRPALRRSGGGGVRKDLHVRPDVPRREVEDAPASDRVLDDRAGGRVQRLGRQHAAAGRLRLVPRAARARAARRRAEGARARHRAARAGEGAVPSRRLHRRGRRSCRAREAR